MVIDIGIDTKSLTATAFLLASTYVVIRAGQGTLTSALIEIVFIAIIAVCLYVSYRLILIVDRVT